MNVVKLHLDLRERGVLLEADGDNLKVDAPAGALTDEDRAALVKAKPTLIRFLARMAGPDEPKDDGRRFDAKASRHPGYTRLYDPVEGRWHDFPTRNCYPSIVELTRKRRSKGGAA